jgi:hypothetical protein
MGCEQSTVFSPEITPLNQSQEAADNGIKILSMGEKANFFKKISTITESIKKSQGGTIVLNHYNYYYTTSTYPTLENKYLQPVDETITLSGIMATVSLNVKPFSIDKNTEITLSLDDEQFMGSIDVTFAPHGLNFSDPALLNISASGLDFTGFNVSNLKLYYVNQVSGLWEEMNCESLSVNTEEGSLSVVNGQLPHFSRYAIGEMP